MTTDLRPGMSEAQIESVAVTRVSLPIDPPMISGAHHIASIDCNVVEVGAGDHVGVGYTFAFSPLEADSITPLIRLLAASLPDSPVGDLREHWGETWKRINFMGRAGGAVMAMSAIDVALWDLNARCLGLPLTAALGGEVQTGTLYGAGGWLSLTEEELIAEALSYRDAGFTGYKMRAGGPDWKADVARVGAVREAVGEEMDLMLDANQAWSVDTAIEAAEALDPIGLAWLEEPIDYLDFQGLATVRDQAPMPIAGGETVYGPWPFQEMIGLSSLDVLQPDLMRCGGITGFLEIIDGLPEGYVVSPHLFTEISVQLVPLSGGGRVEYLPSWFQHLFEGVPDGSTGTMAPHGDVGLGISLAEECRQRWQVARFDL